MRTSGVLASPGGSASFHRRGRGQRRTVRGSPWTSTASVSPPRSARMSTPRSRVEVSGGRTFERRQPWRAEVPHDGSLDPCPRRARRSTDRGCRADEDILAAYPQLRAVDIAVVRDGQRPGGRPTARVPCGSSSTTTSPSPSAESFSTRATSAGRPPRRTCTRRPTTPSPSTPRDRSAALVPHDAGFARRRRRNTIGQRVHTRLSADLDPGIGTRTSAVHACVNGRRKLIRAGSTGVRKELGEPL